MATIRLVGSDIDILADQLTDSLGRYSSFDGLDPVVGRILAGDFNVNTSLRGQTRIDVVLSQTIKSAIRRAEARGRAEGQKHERERLARQLGLLD